MRLWLPLLALGWNVSAAVMQSQVELKDLVLNKPYKAMQGPVAHTRFSLTGEIWIVGMNVDIKSQGRAAPELLCHSRFGLGDAVFASISQGLNAIEFPPGYGLPVRIGRGRIFFGAQLQSPSASSSSPQHVDVRGTLKYLTPAEATQQKLKALHPFWFAVHAHANKVPGTMAHGHFVVPPGRHEFSTDFQAGSEWKIPATAVVHYLRIHLHAFGAGVELYDLSARKTVWKGQAVTDAKQVALTSTDFYSSAEGFKLYAAHKYRLTAVYDNTTASAVEGMAFLQAYYE